MIKIFLCFFLFLNSFTYAGWLDRKAEGWAWYEDKSKDIPIDEPKEIEVTETSSEKIQQIKKDLEEKLAEAIINPSVENIQSYLALQNYWMNKSKEFSKLWTKTLLQYPEMDASVNGRPVTQYGIQVHKKITADDTRKIIEKISENYALFFFYEGGCRISQAVALVILEFSKKYNWEIMPLSMDGKSLELFQNNLINNSFSEDINIKTFPAIVVVNPTTKEIIPIAFGLSSIDHIERNIKLQFENKEKL